MAIQVNTKLVAIVDDDDLMRGALQGMMKAVGWTAQAFASAEEFLKSGMSDRGYPHARNVWPGVAGQAEC